ncbi:hypothetical protein J2Z66_005766 [Paenibacillus eucommiae]|uniref:Uncharacterized protein n=1 Tax=Paenibacillus eucommiae TaxID=1355755 RepID=A0ABS4J2V8_9BACL|nr:hypothetical protein [Paenibacillus eucommiae]
MPTKNSALRHTLTASPFLFTASSLVRFSAVSALHTNAPVPTLLLFGLSGFQCPVLPCRVEGGRLEPSSVRSFKRIVQFSRNPIDQRFVVDRPKEIPEIRVHDLFTSIHPLAAQSSISSVFFNFKNHRMLSALLDPICHKYTG